MGKEVFLAADINRNMAENRRVAYKETDNLFFKAQRGEIEMSEWLAAVQAIKEKFPYVTEDLIIEIPDAEVQLEETEEVVDEA